MERRVNKTHSHSMDITGLSYNTSDESMIDAVLNGTVVHIHTMPKTGHSFGLPSESHERAGEPNRPM
ncbi:hypothetical protein [Paenibacillus apiarius]|uniref:hypothetical protein n=1 Tax=Paenibacillus apiarius TaxID=46240 RepID=UPI003B3ACF7D